MTRIMILFEVKLVGIYSDLICFIFHLIDLWMSAICNSFTLFCHLIYDAYQHLNLITAIKTQLQTEQRYQFCNMCSGELCAHCVATGEFLFML